MSDSKQKQDFEAWLEGRHELSGIYNDAGKEVPAASQDHMILSAARKAAEKRNWLAALNPFQGNWAVPVGVFAVAVLTIGIVNIAGLEAERGETSPEAMSPIASVAPGKKTEDRIVTASKPAAMKKAKEAVAMNDERERHRLRKRVRGEAGFSRAPSPRVAATSAADPSMVALLSEKTAMDTRADEHTSPAVAVVSDTANIHAAPAWLGRIRELCENGKFEQAREELKLFRKSHPAVDWKKSLSKYIDRLSQ